MSYKVGTKVRHRKNKVNLPVGTLGTVIKIVDARHFTVKWVNGLTTTTTSGYCTEVKSPTIIKEIKEIMTKKTVKKVVKKGTPIGNSGFSFTKTSQKSNSSGYGRQSTGIIVRGIKSNDVIFSLDYGYEYQGRGTRATRTYSGSKDRKFYGLDNRYYFINHRGQWGQISPDGAVIKSDRTVLKTINFYPLYVKKPTPVPKPEPPISKPAPIPIISKPVLASITPVGNNISTPMLLTNSISTNVKEPEETEETFIEGIIKWIKNLINRIFPTLR